MINSIGSHENFTSPHNSVRDILSLEARGRIVFDDDEVFKRLELDKMPQQNVDGILEDLTKNPSAKKARIELRDLAQKSDGIYDATVADSLNEVERSHAKRELESNEKAMYAPLQTLFNGITDAVGSARFIQRLNSTLLGNEGFEYGFPGVIPDFSVVDREGIKDSRYWRLRYAWVEVKASEKDGSKPKVPGENVKPVVAQTADYARLHLSTRPFLLFSVGLLIFGSKFCVGIYDREGVIFSPIHDLQTNLDIFIRVVWSLCGLDTGFPTHLGQDPTARIEGDANPVMEVNRKLIPGWPVFIVDPIGSDRRSWRTEGGPLWGSLTFIGRGVIIYKVREYNKNTKKAEGPVMIMKTAWRRSGRSSESDIYNTIQNGGTPKALATWDAGGDVEVKVGAVKHRITVPYLRRKAVSEDDRNMMVFHRLIVKEVGTQLWYYKSEMQYLKALRSCLEAHKILWERGILHRDINPGNLLLSDTGDSDDADGILLDVEFARVQGGTAVRTKIHVPPQAKWDPAHNKVLGWTEETIRTRTVYEEKKGVEISGSYQFMAVELLTSILRDHQIAQIPQHDVESFVWVMAYVANKRMLQTVSVELQEAQKLKRRKAANEQEAAARKKAVDDTIKRKALLTELFRESFGEMTLEKILAARSAVTAKPFECAKHTRADLQPTLNRAFSKPLQKLMVKLTTESILEEVVRVSRIDWGSESVRQHELTHDSLLKEINKTIRELQQLEGAVDAFTAPEPEIGGSNDRYD